MYYLPQQKPKDKLLMTGQPSPLINLPPTKNQALRMAYSPLVSINKALLNPPYVWRVRQVDYCSHSDCPPWYIHIAPRPDFAYKDGQVQPMCRGQKRSLILH